MELLFSSAPSPAAAICVLITTLLIAVIPIWLLNTLWLRPKRLERVLRAQGLCGDSYSLFHNNNSNQTHMLEQHHPNSPPFALSADVAPRVLSSLHFTITKHGKNSYFWEDRTPKVIITDPNQIKEAFNNIHVFQKPKLGGNARFLSNGLLNNEGEKWAKHRRIINPAFHLEKLKNMLPAFSESCHNMISTWNGMLSSDGKCEIDVWPFLQNLTCDVISRTAFGSNYAEGEKIFQLLRKQGYLFVTSKNNNIPILRYLSTSTTKKMKAIERDIHDSIEVIIKKKEEAMKNGEAYNKDLLSMLLESNKLEIEGNGNNRGVGMSNQEVSSECKLFYLAGQETTSSLLVWTLVLLSRFPEWQTRAREEVFQVFGNQNPHFHGLSQLKIVPMILYEVLRLYPPAQFFSRTLEKDVKLGNLTLPKGTSITMPILFTHHDGDIWGDDSKEFKPERFSEGIAKATKGQVSFYPFGWGPRICIGQNFTLLEAKLVVSLLLQHFSFQLSPAYQHAPTVVLTLQPKHGAHIVLHKL